MLAPTALLEARRKAVDRSLVDAGLDALVAIHLPNIRYLTNFESSAGLLVCAPSRLYLLADFRYSSAVTALLESTSAPPATTAVSVDGSYDEALATVLLERFSGRRVGFESAHLSVKRHTWLAARIAQAGAAAPVLVPADGLIERGRLVKDAHELRLFREAGRRLSDVARGVLAEVVREGRSELAMAADIDARLRAGGFERPAFDTIVAAGPSSALPHAHPGDRVARGGDLVLLDFGGVFHGYSVDLTRTTCLGDPGAEARRIYAAVAEAQDAALAAVKAGVPADEVDGAARAALARWSLADAFGHGTGHGLGLEIHEEPRIGKRRPEGPEPAVLDVGMVCTIEPGAYVPEFGGVRLEDDVIVTADGCERITDVPRETRLLNR